MFKDTLTTIIVIIVGTITLFVFPVIKITEDADNTTRAALQDAVNSYSSEVSNEKSLSIEKWEAFSQKVKSITPSGEPGLYVQVIDDNTGKKSSFGSSTVYGENVYYTVQAEEILNQLYQNGKIDFSQGCIITFEAEYKSQNPFKNTLMGITGQGTTDSVRATAECK